MKRITTLLIIVFFAAFQVTAQADRIVGYWLTEESDAQIQIYKSGNKYYGKIVWLDEPNEDDGSPKVDDENPDPALQNRPILGLLLLKNFVYNTSAKNWDSGTIYDPDSGNTYDSYMWFEDEPNKLYIKGYVLGMRFIGRRTAWTRETSKR